MKTPPNYRQPSASPAAPVALWRRAALSEAVVSVQNPNLSQPQPHAPPSRQPKVCRGVYVGGRPTTGSQRLWAGRCRVEVHACRSQASCLSVVRWSVLWMCPHDRLECVRRTWGLRGRTCVTGRAARTEAARPPQDLRTEVATRAPTGLAWPHHCHWAITHCGYVKETAPQHGACKGVRDADPCPPSLQEQRPLSEEEQVLSAAFGVISATKSVNLFPQLLEPCPTLPFA